MAEKKKTRSKAQTGKYYSSDSIRRGYESSQIPAASAEVTRRLSPFGKYSPRAALTDLFSGAIDLFRDDEGKAGASMGREVARKKVERNMNDPEFKFKRGGKAKTYKKGGKVRGCGAVSKKMRPAKMVVMKGS